MTTNLHAHISTSQRDCGGPTYDEWVEALNDDERAEHFVNPEHWTVRNDYCGVGNLRDKTVTVGKVKYRIEG